MTVVKATIHGAISIVNAIATGKGADPWYFKEG